MSVRTRASCVELGGRTDKTLWVTPILILAINGALTSLSFRRVFSPLNVMIQILLEAHDFRRNGHNPRALE